MFQTGTILGSRGEEDKDLCIDVCCTLQRIKARWEAKGTDAKVD